jgi:hypothetical protein
MTTGTPDARDRLALGDLAALAVDRRHDRLVERLDQQRRQGFRVRSARVAGLPFLESGVHRRLAAAHRIIALVLGHGVTIYQLHARLLICYNRKTNFSLPFPCQAFDYHSQSSRSL